MRVPTRSSSLEMFVPRHASKDWPTANKELPLPCDAMAVYGKRANAIAQDHLLVIAQCEPALPPPLFSFPYQWAQGKGI